MFLDWHEKVERARRRQQEINRETAERKKRYQRLLATALETEKQELLDQAAARLLSDWAKKKKAEEEEVKRQIKAVNRRLYLTRHLISTESLKELANPDYRFFDREENLKALLDLYFPNDKENWISSYDGQTLKAGDIVEDEPLLFQAFLQYDTSDSNAYSDATSTTSIYLFDQSGKFVKSISALDGGSDAEFKKSVFFAPQGHAPESQRAVIEAITIHPASLPSWVYSFALVTQLTASKGRSWNIMLSASEEKVDASGIENLSARRLKSLSDLQGIVSADKPKHTVVSDLFAAPGRSKSSWYQTEIARGYVGDAPQPEIFKNLGKLARPELPRDTKSWAIPANLIGNQLSIVPSDASVCAFQLDKTGNVLHVQYLTPSTRELIHIEEQTTSIAFAYLTPSDQSFPKLSVWYHVPDNYLDMVAGVGQNPDSDPSEEPDPYAWFSALTVRPETIVSIDRPPNCLFPLAVAHRLTNEWKFHSVPADVLGIRVGDKFLLEDANPQQLEALLKLCMGELADVSNPSLNIVDMKFDGKRPNSEIITTHRANLASQHFQFEARYAGSKISVVAYNMLGKPIANEIIQAGISEWANSKNKGTTMSLSFNDKIDLDRRIKDFFQGKLPTGATDAAECLPTTLKIFGEPPQSLAKYQAYRWTIGTVDLSAVGPTGKIVRTTEGGAPLFKLDLLDRSLLAFDLKEFPGPEECFTIKSVYLRMAARDLKAMDVGGSSDPFVTGNIIILNQAKQTTPFKSKVVKKDLNPEWGNVTSVDLSAPARVMLECTVFDKDLVGQDEIGRVSVDITQYLDPASLPYEKDRDRTVEIPLTSPKSKDPVGKRGTLILRISRK